MDLKQKRILLTGATGGIGSALAIQLAKQGAYLILAGRKQTKLDELKNSLENASEHLCIRADLEADGIETINTACLNWKDQGIYIDIVINNAGTNTFAYLAQQTAADITRETQLNMLAPILLSQHALSWLKRPGIILNIGSTFSAIGYPGYSTYCATKAAIHRFSEALQRELTGTGIQVLYLAPRATNTKLNDQRVTELNTLLGNKTDSPEYVASEIIATLKAETKYRWLGWPEKLFVRLNQLLPSVVSSSIRKQHTRITEFASKSI
ncbi:short chain dehydrogenase [Photobacterium frigidiphilum]|uniref:Short chain dehydrogenase n=1 Tax=Photobacterium frigidiphilum TaxID=264736 RepID=A0A2T3JMC1_9GAMM|nr:SDR family oxidoreductase [Photobacterium frigidiphilum]PSU50186.1 short chain dehydrogenase [Photobacterium frigidiphilum]